METQKPTYILRTGRTLQSVGKNPHQIEKLFHTNQPESLKKTSFVKKVFNNPRIKFTYVAILVIIFSGLSFLIGLPFNKQTGTQTAEAVEVPGLNWAVDKALDGINCNVLYSNLSVGDEPKNPTDSKYYTQPQYLDPDGNTFPFGKTQGPGSSGVAASYREVSSWPGLFNPGAGSWVSEASALGQTLQNASTAGNAQARGEVLKNASYKSPTVYADDGGVGGTFVTAVPGGIAQPLGLNSTVYEQYRYSLKWTAWNVAQMGGNCGIGALMNSQLTDLANMFFGIYTFFAFMFIELIGGVLSLNISNAFVGIIAGITQNMYKTLFIPYLAPVVILAALWVAWQAIVKKRVSMGIQGLLWMLFATLVGVYYLVQPAAVLTWVFRQTETVVNYLITVIPKNGANLADSSSRCYPRGETDSQRAVNRSLRCTLWSTFYYSFWAQGQFGSEGAGATVSASKSAIDGFNSSSTVVRYKNHDGSDTPNAPGYDNAPITELYLEGFYLSRDEVMFPPVAKGGNAGNQLANRIGGLLGAVSSLPSFGTSYLDPLKLATGRLAGALSVSESNTEVINTPGRVLVNKPYSRWLTIAALSCQTGKEIKEGGNVSYCANSVAWDAFRGNNFSEKISVVVFGLMSMLFAVTPILIMAMILLWYQIFVIFLWLPAPIFMLIGVNPGFGRKVLLNWFEQIASNLLKQFVTALFLGALMFLMAVFALAPIFYMFKVVFIALLGFAALFIRSKIVKGAANVNFGGYNGGLDKSISKMADKGKRIAVPMAAYGAGQGAMTAVSQRKGGASWGDSIAAGTLGGLKGVKEGVMGGRRRGRGSPWRSAMAGWNDEKRDQNKQAKKDAEERAGAEEEQRRQEEETARQRAQEEDLKKKKSKAAEDATTLGGKEESLSEELASKRAERERLRKLREKDKERANKAHSEFENIEDKIRMANIDNLSPEEIRNLVSASRSAQRERDKAEGSYRERGYQLDELDEDIDRRQQELDNVRRKRESLEKFANEPSPQSSSPQTTSPQGSPSAHSGSSPEIDTSKLEVAMDDVAAAAHDIRSSVDTVAAETRKAKENIAGLGERINRSKSENQTPEVKVNIESKKETVHNTSGTSEAAAHDLANIIANRIGKATETGARKGVKDGMRDIPPRR